MINEFVDDIPFAKKGFGLATNIYTSGRTTVHVAAHGGLNAVTFYGKQCWLKHRFLKVDPEGVFMKIARVQVAIDGVMHRIEMNDTLHYPFGYTTECVLSGVKLRYELALDNNAILQRVKVLDNPERKKVTARLLMSTRSWAPAKDRLDPEWVLDKAAGTATALVTDVTDGKEEHTLIRFGSANPASFSLTETQSFKIHLNSTVPADEHVFHLVFNPGESEDVSAARIDRKLAAFAVETQNIARFKTGNPVLDSALTYSNPMTAALEVADMPGGVKASHAYWIWGWDSMVHAEALMLCGYADLVKRMLLFFKAHAHPEHGICHAFPSNRPSAATDCLPKVVQGFYAILLYHYYAATGDEETLAACLPLARQVMERANAHVAAGDPLARGWGWFPDSPMCLEQRMDDYSLINNSVYYQALRAWNELTGEMGEQTDKIKKNMCELFWDKDERFWIDSVDGKTGAQRKYYPIYGQMYVSAFALEPRRGDHKVIAAFMKEHLLAKHGIWMYPPDRPGFMADGIQLGEYFPVADRHYWNIMNAVGDSASLEDFERIITPYWQICTYPEGQTNDIVNTDPGEYEDTPGIKQAFTAKCWCCDALELHLGLRLTLNGLSFNPLGGEKDFEVHNLSVRGKVLDVRRTGAGKDAVYFLNGDKLADGFIPWTALKEHNALKIVMA